jgi:hypothetical protein
MFVSCDKEETKLKETNNLKPELINIENEVMTGIAEVMQCNSQLDEVFNKIYDFESRKDQPKEYVDGLINDFYTIGNTSEREANEDEKSIFNSFQISMDNRGNMLASQVAAVYINKIEDLNIERDSKNYCISRLYFYKKFLETVDFDDVNSDRIHDDCRGRSCHNCCMYKKAKALSNSNIVARIIFYINVAPAMSQMAAVCGFDCIFG